MKKQRIPWDAGESALENARVQLPEMARGFFAAGRKATKKKTKIKVLHRFRLEVKRFRYTLELFQPFYGKALEERLGVLRRAQQDLGALNDIAVTRKLILAAGSRKDPVVKDLLAHLDQIERQKASGFLDYWRDTFASPEVERKWVWYLKTFAGRRKSGIA
ncbi:MAG: CHAD domain-containing protein [bacterium]|nr:CHAD domain-containing protein [bacterium]